MNDNQFERVYLAAFSALFDKDLYENTKDDPSAKRQAVCGKARELAEEMLYNIELMETKDR